MGEAMKSLDRLFITVPLCVVTNYVVTLWILSSRWGSVVLMDDTFGRDKVLVPVAAGLLLGVGQALLVGHRAALLAVSIGLVGVATLVLASTLLAQAVGIAIGCLAVWAALAAWERAHRTGWT